MALDLDPVLYIIPETYEKKSYARTVLHVIRFYCSVSCIFQIILEIQKKRRTTGRFLLDVNESEVASEV